MTIPTSFLDELRARTTLSTVIGRTVALKKAAREYKGCCPFHQEKTASFYVNDDKGFYHCFGCSAHGDVIRWMTEQQGLPFLDAVRELAAAAGMEVPAARPGDAEKDARFERNREVMARAAAFFSTELRQFGADAAQDYLARRGIDLGLAMQFDLGWAPNGRRGERSRLREELKDVGEDTLIELGLMKRNDSGDIYDFFRGRIMFPIHDQRGRVIAFGGRMVAAGEPKYLNSPDTPLFDKGRTLYNHHRASPAARQAKRLVIVEGYMDVIAMARAGVHEAVAPNGTAITEAQLALAWKLDDAPILCLDGDAAGQRAGHRAAKIALPLLKPGATLAFVQPPAGQDPDDMVRQEGGTAEIGAMLASSTSLVDVLFRGELQVKSIDTPEGKADLAARLRALVGTIRDRDMHDAIGGALRELFDARANRAPGRAPGRRRAAETNERASRGNRPAIEVAIVYGLLRYPEMLSMVSDVLSARMFEQEQLGAVVDVMGDVAMTPGYTEDTLAAAFERAGVGDTVQRVKVSSVLPFSFTRGEKTAAAQEELIDAIYRLRG